MTKRRDYGVAIYAERQRKRDKENQAAAAEPTRISLRRRFSIAMNFRLRTNTGSRTEMNGTSLYICALRRATVAWLVRTCKISRWAAVKKSAIFAFQTQAFPRAPYRR